MQPRLVDRIYLYYKARPKLRAPYREKFNAYEGSLGLWYPFVYDMHKTILNLQAHIKKLEEEKDAKLGDKLSAQNGLDVEELCPGAGGAGLPQNIPNAITEGSIRQNGIYPDW